MHMARNAAANAMRRLFALLLLSLLLTINVFTQTPTSRAEALRTLRGCATRPITLGCNEDTASYLVDLYNHGDRSLLGPLLNAGLHSDGALSELLGVFHSDVLTKNPRAFLSALRSRIRKQQRDLCWLAGATDGGGMPTEDLRRVRQSLRAIAARRNDSL